MLSRLRMDANWFSDVVAGASRMRWDVNRARPGLGGGSVPVCMVADWERMRATSCARVGCGSAAAEGEALEERLDWEASSSSSSSSSGGTGMGPTQSCAAKGRQVGGWESHGGEGRDK